MDATNEEEMVVSGRKALLRHKLHTAIRKGVINPLQAFKDQVRIIKTGKRVIKATKSTTTKDKAERTAETLAKERATTPQILGGLIDEKVAKSSQSKASSVEEELETLCRKAQSLEAKATSKNTKNKPNKKTPRAEALAVAATATAKAAAEKQKDTPPPESPTPTPTQEEEQEEGAAVRKETLKGRRVAAPVGDQQGEDADLPRTLANKPNPGERGNRRLRIIPRPLPLHPP
jgi:hypothetical protein